MEVWERPPADMQCPSPLTQHLNSEYNVNVPFILMNSFNTDEDTARIIQKYRESVRVVVKRG